jgi:hypothetical protein
MKDILSAPDRGGHSIGSPRERNATCYRQLTKQRGWDAASLLQSLRWLPFGAVRNEF